MAQKKRGTTAEVLARKDKEDRASGRNDPKEAAKEFKKRKTQRERTKASIKQKNIEQGLPTTRQGSEIVLDKKGVKTQPGQKSSDVLGVKEGFRNTKAFQIAQKAAGFITGTEPQEVLPSGEFAPREPGTVLTGSPALGINLGAVAGGADAIAGGDAAVNQIVSTARSELGGILGKYVLNPVGTTTPTVSKVGQMTINSKTTTLSKGFLAKAFSPKAMALYGAWASSVFLGRWGNAEAPEAILIPLRDLIENAKTPEDWALVEEHLESAAELSDNSKWEEVMLWSPFAAIPGIKNKVNGVAEGVQVLAESAAKVQEIQNLEEETGESDFARERREGDEASTQRGLEEQALDSQYFQLIRDKKYEEAEELLQSRLKGEDL